MVYGDIVQPAEMQDVKAWVAPVYEALRHQGVSAPQAEIRQIEQGYKSVQLGLAVERTPLRLQGKVYDTGLGTHAVSVIEVKLSRPARRLRGFAGVDDNEYTRKHAKPLVFAVETAGKEVWKSGEQVVSAAPAAVDIDLAGNREFTLRVTGPFSGGHADWADMTVALDDDSTLTLGAPPEQRECFSFVYGGQGSADVLSTWTLSEEALPERADATGRRIIRTDPKTGLQAIVEILEYKEFPVVEWLVRFKNTGTKDTPILADIRSLELLLPPEALLHYHTGDYCAIDGYEPHQIQLKPGAEIAFAPDGGRPTNRAWPYYNLEYPGKDRGVIAVVGWSGQWSSRFQGRGDSIRVVAGQELTHFKLLPGEEVRTPISVLMFWRGDRVRSQNLWRRWMLACNLPRPGGKLPEPMLPAYTGRWFAEMGTATTPTQIAFIDRYTEEGIKLDYWWMDAGWYPCNGEWYKTGTWEPDLQRFPKGLREITDYAHGKGMKSLVWFEPERVTPDSWLAQQHPEWLLDGTLLNLGNPAALTWLIEHTTKVIKEQGIDLYRQDFNMEPLAHWRKADAPDRRGITEMRHVEGYLAFWKELRRRFPDMLIDSCASGGRRNDLETMRLSVPLHKTDYAYDDLPTKQAFHHSLALWLPYFGAYVLPVDTVDTYAFRSSLAPMTLLTYDLRRRDADWKKLKALTEEWRKLVATEYYYGDYYPLTPYDRSEESWIGWQFHRPDLGTGLVQAFRRNNSPFVSARFKLRGLDPAATYRITDLDRRDAPLTRSGKELLESGLAITMEQSPQAVVLVYEAVK